MQQKMPLIICRKNNPTTKKNMRMMSAHHRPKNMPIRRLSNLQLILVQQYPESADRYFKVWLEPRDISRHPTSSQSPRLPTPRGVEYGGLIRAWRSTCTAMTGESRLVDLLMRLADIGASTREVAGVTVECREDDGVSTVGLPILPLGTGVGGCDLVEPGVGFAPYVSFNAPLACAPL